MQPPVKLANRHAMSDALGQLDERYGARIEIMLAHWLDDDALAARLRGPILARIATKCEQRGPVDTTSEDWIFSEARREARNIIGPDSVPGVIPVMRRPAPPAHAAAQMIETFDDEPERRFLVPVRWIWFVVLITIAGGGVAYGYLAPWQAPTWLEDSRLALQEAAGLASSGAGQVEDVLPPPTPSVATHAAPQLAQEAQPPLPQALPEPVLKPIAATPSRAAPKARAPLDQPAMMALPAIEADPPPPPPSSIVEAPKALPALAALQAPSPPAPAIMPAVGSPRVFIHYSQSDPGAVGQAEQLARLLTAQGVAVAGVRTVPFPIGKASVRYFFSGNRSVAQQVARLGSVLPALENLPGPTDFTRYRPQPQPGTLEVWLPSG